MQYKNHADQSNKNTATACFETLEERTLLTVAPTFSADIPEYAVIDSSGGVTLGIDGFDADGDDLDITVTAADGSGVNWVIDDKDSGDRFAVLYFEDSEGNSIGEILVQLFEERAPLATERFITLATNYFVYDEETEDYDMYPATVDDPAFYTDVLVHRVISEFMVQTGDADKGTGSGGSPLGDFDNEYDDYLSFAGTGVLATANSGVDTNDSQFFITDVPASWLDDLHTIFGQMISGQDVYHALINTPVDSDDRPLDPPVMSGIEIVQSPQDGSVTLWVDNDFDEATEVTITLTDSEGLTVSQTITLVPADDVGEERPEVQEISAISYAAGEIEPDVAEEIAFQVEYDGSLPLSVTSWVTYDGPGTILTEIVDPTTEGGDYTLLLTMPAEYNGDSFTVAVSATLAGYDNITPSVQRFTVSFGDRPAVDDPGALDMPAGDTEVFELIVSDQDSTDFIIDATTTQDGVTVSIDPDTYELTVTTPADFYGVFTVTITTSEAEFAAFTGLTPRSTEITIATLGDRPVISPLTNDEVRVAMGETEPADPVTVTITDDGGEALDVEISSSDSDVTVSISDDDEDGVYDIVITVDEDFLGGATITITAVEDVAGADDLEPAEYIFLVTTLGDRPTITLPDEDLYLSGGDFFSFDPNIFDDSGLALDVTIESNMSDDYIWLDEVLNAANEVDHWQVTVDLRDLPTDYSGYFKVTISAIEADIDGGVDATDNVFYVFTQPDFDPEIINIVETEDDAIITKMDSGLLFTGSDEGLEIYDISDPTDPQLLGSYSTSYEIGDIEVDGSTVYLAMRGAAYSTWVYGVGNIFVLDITDPDDIQTLATIESTSMIMGIEVVGDTIYSAEYTAGLAIYDISDLDDIPEANTYTEIGDYSLAVVNDLVVGQNGYIYVMENSEQVLTIDVSDAENPEVTDRFKTTIKTFWRYDPNGHKEYKYSIGIPSMAVIAGDNNDILLVADTVTGIWAFDISDPAETVKNGWLGWPATYIAVSGDMAVISLGETEDSTGDSTKGSGFHRFVDVSDPENMNVTQRMFAPGWVGMPSIDNGIIAAPYQAEGIALIDASTLLDMTTYAESTTVMSSDAVDATELKIKLSGSGLIRIHRDSDNDNVITSIEVVGTTTKTSLTISAIDDPDFELPDISIYGSLRTFKVEDAVVAGNVTINGSVRKIYFEDVGAQVRNEIALTITGDPDVDKQPTVNITMGDVSDLRIDSSVPINKLTLKSWLDDESDLGADIAEVDLIEAPSIKKLLVTEGDFQADVRLNSEGDALVDNVLGKAVIEGNIHESDWSIYGEAATVIRGSEGDWSYTVSADIRPTYVFSSRTLTLDDGTRVVVKISGGGSVLVTPSNIDGIDLDSIEVLDAQPTTKATIYSPDRILTVTDISADNTLKSFNGSKLTVLGDVSISGGIRKLYLGDIGSGDRVEQILTIDGDHDEDDESMTIKLGDVSDLSIISGISITTLSVQSWQDNETDIDENTLEEDTIVAPYIKKLQSAGDFRASLSINTTSETVSEDVVLYSVVMGGDVSDAIWTLNGRLKKAKIADDLSGTIDLVSAGKIYVYGDTNDLTLKLSLEADILGSILSLDSLVVKGSIESSRILATGNIGTITTGALISSDIYAGYVAENDDDITELPSADDFTSSDPEYFDMLGEIRKITVKGLKVNNAWTDSFVESSIAAGVVRKAYLRYADTDTNEDNFGIMTDNLWKYVYKDFNPANNQKWTPTVSDAPDALENLVIEIV